MSFTEGRRPVSEQTHFHQTVNIHIVLQNQEKIPRVLEDQKD